MNINQIVITLEMLALIAEIEEFKGSWRVLGSLAPERLAALRKVATIESIGSSTRIEGVKLSDRQIETLLSNLDQHSFTTRDEQEVAGYAEVMEILFESWETIPIFEKTIKKGEARKKNSLSSTSFFKPNNWRKVVSSKPTTSSRYYFDLG